MRYLDSYKARIRSRGDSVRDAMIISTNQLLKRQFSDSPSYQEVFINNETSPIGVHIVDDSQTKEQKLIISPFVELNTGFLVHLNSSIWMTLITDKFETHWKGALKKCESSLKWLDSEGIIKETPFTLKSSPSAANLQEDKIMILSKERRVILVQSNDDTRQIKKDKRFIFDGRCWKVVGYNGLTEGLLELTLEEDIFNEATDDMTIRIANYKQNGDTSTAPPEGGLW